MAHWYVTVGEELEVFHLLFISIKHIVIKITVTTMSNNRRIPTADPRPATAAVEVATTSPTYSVILVNHVLNKLATIKFLL